MSFYSEALLVKSTQSLPVFPKTLCDYGEPVPGDVLPLTDDKGHCVVLNPSGTARSPFRLPVRMQSYDGVERTMRNQKGDVVARVTKSGYIVPIYSAEAHEKCIEYFGSQYNAFSPARSGCFPDLPVYDPPLPEGVDFPLLGLNALMRFGSSCILKLTT
jgi:hypothetical protein